MAMGLRIQGQTLLQNEFLGSLIYIARPTIPFAPLKKKWEIAKRIREHCLLSPNPVSIRFKSTDDKRDASPHTTGISAKKSSIT
jgi:DNA repair photolyase